MARKKYNSSNRIGVKRGPYRKRSKVLVYESGRKNYAAIKELKEKIDTDKNFVRESDRKSIKNDLDARIEQAIANGTKLTSTGFYGMLSKVMYPAHNKYDQARTRMLANMGLTMQDIADELGVDITALAWDTSSDDGGESYSFTVNAPGFENYTYELTFEYSGTGFKKRKKM